MNRELKSYPGHFSSEDELEEAISRPTPELIETMKVLDGDIALLGVSGKMGISMACMTRRACHAAGVDKRIVGVSRFGIPENRVYLEERGVETLAGDLLDLEFLDSIPEFGNIVYLAGTKFGTQGNEPYTWAMNAYLPGLVAERFKQSRIVALSTGCVYPLVDVASGGSLETDRPEPMGEYAQSCLGRERVFEFSSAKNGTKVALIRLNYSVEMRYGVLVDIATKIANNEPVDVSMGYANVIWQGDANAFILRCLNLASCPARPVNLTGQETISIRKIAHHFGKLLEKEVIITGEENPSALLSNSSQIYTELGMPKIPLEQVIAWTARWVSDGKALHGKPTHFEVRDGKY